MTNESRPRGLRRAFSRPPSARSFDRDVDDEIQFHIDCHIADLVARGVPPTIAREQAMQQYGDIGASRRELARVDRARLSRIRWSTFFDALLQDVVVAVRIFRNRPGFAFGVAFVLALGIGANATMFGVIDRLLLRPPPHVADPANVMMIRYQRAFRGQVNSQNSLSFPMYLDLVGTPGAFKDVTAYTGASLTIGRGANARPISANRVTTNYFRVLGVQPRLGRFFAPDEDGSPTAPNLAVLSYSYWVRELDASNGVIGQTLPIGDAKFTIIGVAPAGFTGVYDDPVDIWVPLTAGVSAAEYENWKASRNGFWLLAIAHLAPGVSRPAAADAATRVIRMQARAAGESDDQLAKERPAITFVSALPREAHADRASTSVAALLGAVSVLVVLIACANVANLQLARGLARRREIAIRIALGVSRGRLMMQLVIESMVLALVGGGGALAATYWGSGFVRQILLGTSDLGGAKVIDARVLTYTALASIVVGILSGLVPALTATRASVSAELKDGVRQGGMSRSRARSVLLLVQTMVSVVLLVGTGLFVRSLRRVESLPLGIEPARTLVATVQTGGTPYSGREARALFDNLLMTATATPGIQAAALSTTLPFYTSWAVRVRVPGRDSLPRVKDGGPYMNEITPDYFAAVGTRILRGRAFTSADTRDAPRVAIINESLARLWWPGENAIGKCLRIGADSNPCSEIVGIAENARRQSIIEDVSVQYFVPLDQSVRTGGLDYVLLVRPRGDLASAAAALRRRLQTAAPNLPFVDVHPLEDLVSPQKRSWRLGASMFALFGGLALLLAAVGLYSVLAYDVTQRTREFGVRVAMGARQGDVLRLVLGSGLRVAIVGGVAGLMVTFASSRLIAPLLFQTSPRDPVVLTSVVAIVTVIALVAALVPARRAIRVDPIVALRSE
jgi:predicted permease